MDPTLEIAARAMFAVAVFAIMAAWEVLRRAARSRPAAVRAGRAISASSWSTRWSVRLLVPTAAVGASLYAAGHGIGLFHVLNLRLSVAALLGFLISTSSSTPSTSCSITCRGCGGCTACTTPTSTST